MITLPHPTILAPLAGYTHIDFRLLVRRIGGAGLVVGEFISSEALSRGIDRSLARLIVHPKEHPVSLQIFGFDPVRMAESARMAVAAGADIIDINAGCPSRRILRSRAGAALLQDLSRLEEILHAVIEAVNVPVTVKTRSGFSEERETYLEVARISEKAGVQAIALHPRTALQGYRGRANWEHIRILKESTSLPVWGNGDISGAGDALRMVEETGCDAVMVGRGALRNPWVFEEISAALEGRPGHAPSPGERLALMAQWLEEAKCPRYRAIPLLIQASYGFDGARIVRTHLASRLRQSEPDPYVNLLKWARSQ
ncbi:MAG TPA: tRNA-dihydrouridine synthase family protein [Thermoanaerobaculia bacterium]|nr:tRNA-dihydrouridine synthase family protein [Thermoanaerobaculia bacterium]HUM28855.1 tRNA-dihydrouridine synthase family protein [Thermoanaerobaculia bacterium]HXK67211.1 tRNA-dihydrouridine synthase family protein [Thermoanaerobaculia bacterium]